MRVTLDLYRLLQDGDISADEYGKLSRLAQRDTGVLLSAVLGRFGVAAVSAAAVMLTPNAITGCVLGCPWKRSVLG